MCERHEIIEESIEVPSGSGEPSSDREMIAVEVARCDKLLESAGYEIEGGDTFGHVERCFQRSERIRGLFGDSWRWEWVGDVDEPVDPDIIRALWAQSVQGSTVEGRSSGFFDLSAIGDPPRWYEFYPIEDAWRGKAATLGSPVFRVRANEMGSFSLPSPASSLDLDAHRKSFDRWASTSAGCLGVLDTFLGAKVTSGGRPGRVFQRAVSKTLKRIGSEGGTVKGGPALESAAADFCEKVGQRWSGAMGRWRVLFSCAPSSFLRLGNMGEDNSCFKWGGEYGHVKTVLPSMPGAVCVFVYRDVCEDPKSGPCGPPRGGISGRCWGFFSGDRGRPGVAIANHYLLTACQVQPSMGSALAALYGKAGAVSQDCLVGDWASPRSISGRGLYVNDDGWTWQTDPALDLRDLLQAQRGASPPGAYNLEDVDSRSCQRCGYNLDEYEGQDCSDCGSLVCSDCGFWDEISEVFSCLGCASPASCDECERIGTSCENIGACGDCGDPLCNDCALSDRETGTGFLCTSCEGARATEREELERIETEALQETENFEALQA